MDDVYILSVGTNISFFESVYQLLLHFNSVFVCCRNDGIWENNGGPGFVRSPWIFICRLVSPKYYFCFLQVKRGYNF